MGQISQLLVHCLELLWDSTRVSMKATIWSHQECQNIVYLEAEIIDGNKVLAMFVQT